VDFSCVPHENGSKVQATRRQMRPASELACV
jgi:hypothetical protein